MCNRWKNLIIFAPAEDRTRDRPHKSPTLYRVAIKAGLYRKAVQVCYILNTTTYSALHFRFVSESQFELPRTIPDTDVLRVHRMGYLRWAPNVTVEKNANHLLPRLRIEPATLRTKFQHSIVSLCNFDPLRSAIIFWEIRNEWLV